MIFANVTDIVIPEGNVTKIQETSSGRVLWEKKKTPIISGDFPRMFIEQISSDNGNSYYSRCWHSNGSSLVYVPNAENETRWRVNDLIEFGRYPLTLKTGTVFNAYYVNNEYELQNYKTAARTVNDATWSFSNARVNAVFANESIYTTGYVETDSTFVTLSSYNGRSVRVSSIKSNFNEYLTAYEADPIAGIMLKPQYPNIRGVTLLTVYSPSLDITIDGEIVVEFFAKR